MSEVGISEKAPVAEAPVVPTWEDRIAASNGTMVFCPESLEAQADEFKEATAEFISKAEEYEKAQQSYEVLAKNFWHNMRVALEKDLSMPGIYGKTIGWNKAAERDGKKVINIMDNQGQ